MACLFCAGPVAVMAGFSFCGGCLKDLPWNLSACHMCGLPLSSAGLACGGCGGGRPPFSHSFIPFLYRPPIDALVKELKFAGRLAASRDISELMLAALQPTQMPECLIPVPLHRRRLIARGYNQAAELARYLGLTCHLPVLPEVCVRTRETVTQTELGAAMRAGNVRGAFRVRTPIGFRHVGIVDDVVTTGSTVAEVARVLMRAGVQRVDVWAAARAPAP